MSRIMAEEVWWAVARSEEVTGVKPINVDLGDQPIVLWRDADGVVRALEDRCPHRRAPLSLGCILKSGAIQCGYHGWTYDGATGRLVDIPNLKGEQKYPPLYRAAAFAVVEQAGFVRVCLNAKAAPPAPVTETAMPLSGTSQVALDHVHYLNALFDAPGLLLAIRGVRFTPYLMTELVEQDGQLVLERSCQWASPHWPAPFTSDFPITLRIATDPVTGESELALRDDAFNLLLSATLAPVPAARGVTQIRWRAKLADRRPGLMAKLLGAGAPLSLHSQIDAAALRQLRPSASIHAASLRSALAERLQLAPDRQNAEVA
jgi:nitrite reductase/ring-hydroxylating ferredoxin subunit